MKRLTFITVLLITIIMSGCQGKAPNYKPSPEDVVNTHGDIKNLKRFLEFYNNVTSGKKDSIRVVNYTIEGDPLLHDLEYDGDVIKSTFDTRRDDFGEGKMFTGTCTSIDVVETTERTEYVLEGCGDYVYNEILTVLNSD